MLYEGMIPPFELVAFEDMKKTQSDQYFTWYMDTIGQRIHNLEQYINLAEATLVLDKTPDSLIVL